MPLENVFQALQKVATLVVRLDVIAADLEKLETMAEARLDRHDAQIADLRERLARLEALRDADRAELRAEVARFGAEAEREALRRQRLDPGESRPPMLPPSVDEP